MEHWKIFQYLWGVNFWWICNCSALKEVLEYEGGIPMVCRWVQELLGYHLTIVHRSNKIMVNIDAITQIFGHLISHHILIADFLSSRDCAKRPRAYADTKFSDLCKVNITETDNPSIDSPPFLISDIFHRFSQDRTNHSATASSLDPSSSPSITKLHIQMCPSSNLCTI